MFIQETYLTSLTQVDSSDMEHIGRVRYDPATGKWYKYVQIINSTNTVAGAAGDPVSYYAGTGYSINKCSIDVAVDGSAIPIGAGVLTAAVVGTLAVSFFCWIQIKGFATLLTAVSSGADGKCVKASTTNKTWAIGAAASDPIIAVCAGLTPFTGVLLDCPF